MNQLLYPELPVSTKKCKTQKDKSLHSWLQSPNAIILHCSSPSLWRCRSKTRHVILRTLPSFPVPERMEACLPSTDCVSLCRFILWAHICLLRKSMSLYFIPYNECCNALISVLFRQGTIVSNFVFNSQFPYCTILCPISKLPQILSWPG